MEKIAIKNIYQVVESSVIVGEELTEWFEIGLGVRQGCTLSPLLFLIFVEGLSQELRKRPGGLREGKITLNHLLFADDLAICAGSRKDLQHLLDVVYKYSCRWRFKFNIAKSNVMVIATKQKQNQYHKYFLGFEVLQVVKTYKYLGLDFQDSLRWTITRQRLVAKAKGRTAMLSKALSEGLSLQAGEVIWWSMIVPVLNFGCELWGAVKCKEMEQVQTEVGRRLLGVSKKTTKAAVRGELGWLSLRALRDIKLLIFWGRLVRMDDSRLAKQIYRSRREQPGRNNWCAQVHETLNSIGLGFKWVNEQVGSEKEWKILIKGTIQARDEKEWLAEMKRKDKLRIYRTLKFELKKEEYLDTIMDNEERRMMTALRSGTNALRIEVGRWKKEKIEERTCTLCANGDTEDEPHALLRCSTYERERRLLYKNVLTVSNYDLKVMQNDEEWLLDMMIGVGCPDKLRRKNLQIEVARFIAAIFRKRKDLLNRIQR